MRDKQWYRYLLMLATLALVAAACGDSDGEGTTVSEGALSGVCPDPIVIQTDWFPEAEHGALYEMVGDDYTVDTNNKVVAGSLVASGVDTEIGRAHV